LSGVFAVRPAAGNFLTLVYLDMNQPKLTTFADEFDDLDLQWEAFFDMHWCSAFGAVLG